MAPAGVVERETMSRRKRTRTDRRAPSPPVSACRPGAWRHLLAVAVVSCLTLVVYGPALDLGFFHLDDPTYVTNNPWIKGFTAVNLQHMLTQPYFANYSPVHLLSYALDYAIAGLDPRAYHLSNLIWGAVAALGVYVLALRLLDRWWAALAASILFVVHPAHVEAVAWISSRKDLIAAAFATLSVAAYLHYRENPSRRAAWYWGSLLLFLLGLAGKLSVVPVPAILLGFDWFLERRRGWQMLIDKIPHGALVLVFGLRVMAAQPPTRNEFEIVVFAQSTLQNLWLLTGLGEYTLARGRPEEINPAAGAAIVVATATLAVGPAFLARWVGGRAVALIYWLLLSLIPPQVLSFVHPVADRYLFFPSVAVAMLIAMPLPNLVGQRGRTGWGVTAVIFAIVAAVWTLAATRYLSEWNDPRSVWYGAAQKSDDVVVYQYLGTHYQDEADRLPARVAGDGAQREQAASLVRAVWGDDPRAESLTPEHVRAFQSRLRELAGEAFEEALRRKGTRVVPNLYFRMGKLAMDTGDFARADLEFQRAFEEAQRHTSADVRGELAVRSLHARALVRWKQKDYEAARQWLERAQQEQDKSGRVWVPELPQHRQQLEAIMQRQ